ncbi:hypothetical protein BH09CHL1_BH09CHL1_13080 [soil metagenome]
MPSFSFHRVDICVYRIFVGSLLPMVDDRNREIANKKEGTRPSPTKIGKLQSSGRLTHHRFRNRGSKTSRSPSPRRLTEITVSMIASPGKVLIHQASRR